MEQNNYAIPDCCTCKSVFFYIFLPVMLQLFSFLNFVVQFSQTCYNSSFARLMRLLASFLEYIKIPACHDQQHSSLAKFRKFTTQKSSQIMTIVSSELWLSQTANFSKQNSLRTSQHYEQKTCKRSTHHNKNIHANFNKEIRQYFLQTHAL